MNPDTESLYKKFLQSGKVSTDSREVARGSIFFALKGPRFNANAFAAEALQKGAAYAVVDDPGFVKGEQFILVEDSLMALQDLARQHRKQFNFPVIGLTGSNGKTTTKELIHTVLGRKYKTKSTLGNLNNHIGVPLTILGLDSSTEVAVVEMGANHVGEIALLASIANPTHGLITNIGKAHVGTFGSFENIVRAKSELYAHLIDHDGQVFINSRNALLSAMAKRFRNPLFYPAPGDYCHCELVSADPFITFKSEKGEKFTTKLIGAYNFENLAAALCVAKFFDVDTAAASRAIADYVPGAMRSQILQQGGNLIILDAYNANPSSMEAAIKNLSGMKAPRKVAILGDMYELENESDDEHRKLGDLLRSEGIEEVYLCGTLIKKALERYPQAKYFASKSELQDHLARNPIHNATILVKASRGMQLEKIVENLK